MNISQHLKLIQNGHKGKVAVYVGPDNLSTKYGDIVLVADNSIGDYEEMSQADIEWLDAHRTIEQPIPEKILNERATRGSSITTWKTCVGVPMHHLVFIDLSFMPTDNH